MPLTPSRYEWRSELADQTVVEAFNRHIPLTVPDYPA
jgi:hypothetical protein